MFGKNGVRWKLYFC